MAAATGIISSGFCRFVVSGRLIGCFLRSLARHMPGTLLMSSAIRLEIA